VGRDLPGLAQGVREVVPGFPPHDDVPTGTDVVVAEHLKDLLLGELHGLSIPYRGGTLHSEGGDADDRLAVDLVDLPFTDGQDLDDRTRVVFGVVVPVQDVHVLGELLQFGEEPPHGATGRDLRSGRLAGGRLLGRGLHGLSIPFLRRTLHSGVNEPHVLPHRGVAAGHEGPSLTGQSTVPSATLKAVPRSVRNREAEIEVGVTSPAAFDLDLHGLTLSLLG
jgi:hypothetical protein